MVLLDMFEDPYLLSMLGFVPWYLGIYASFFWLPGQAFPHTLSSIGFCYSLDEEFEAGGCFGAHCGGIELSGFESSIAHLHPFHPLVA